MISLTLKSRRMLLASLMLTILAGARTGAQQAGEAPIALQPRYVPGEVLVGVADDTNDAATIPVLEHNVGFVTGHHGGLHAYRMKLNDGISLQSAITRLKRQPGVLYAEPNYIRHTCATPNDTYFALLSVRASNYQRHGARGTSGRPSAKL